MSKISLHLDSEQEMIALAADLARLAPARTCFLLAGDLGMGKTVFARAFVRTLAGDPDLAVTSPTFNLVLPYDTPQGIVRHFDLYRIKDPQEMEELGLYELSGTRATLIEWPERLAPADMARLKHVIHVHITADAGGPTRRRVDLDVSGALMSPDLAFVFAAGKGERMRPLTDELPKPLVPVAGVPMLETILDETDRAGVTHVIINTHHQAQKINAYVAARQARGVGPDIVLSHEEDILETGGGMVHAAPLIDREVFFAINGDSLLLDNPADLPLLTRLAMAFDPVRMDMMIALYPLEAPSLTPLVGDYVIAPDGRLIRAAGEKKGTHMFTGSRILHRRVLDGAPQGAFSFLKFMDRAQQAGRLYGLVHKGPWHHLTTPQDVEKVSAFLRAQARAA